MDSICNGCSSIALERAADELKKMQGERDALALAIRDTAVKVGICAENAFISQPHSLMLCDYLSVVCVQKKWVAPVKTFHLDWIGCAFGIFGAIMLALNASWSGYGWIAFLISNIAWIRFALIKNTKSILVMQAAFTFTTLIGITRWLL